MTTPGPLSGALLSAALWFAVRAVQGARRLGRPGGLVVGPAGRPTDRRR